MSWKEEVFLNFNLYAVTNIPKNPEGYLEKIEGAYRGGADIVQLRSKYLSDKEFYELGLKARTLADRFKKLLFVNDRLDLAMAIHADGIHLGQNDLPLSTLRRLLERSGIKMWVGKSTHSLEQGLQASQEKPDYLAVGPVFETPTKPDYHPVGLQYVQEAAQKIKLPIVAIGGIDESNLTQVLKAGARRIAVVRAIFSAKNPYQATQTLKSQLGKKSYENSNDH